VFTAVERHRRMPYLKNLVGQVAPQALPDLRENSLYETLSFFFDQTGRFSDQRRCSYEESKSIKETNTR